MVTVFPLAAGVDSAGLCRTFDKKTCTSSMLLMDPPRPLPLDPITQ